MTTDAPEAPDELGAQEYVVPVTVLRKPRRILFCVHRYAPFPGGSENYVKDMAEEAASRGHEVAVFAGEHKGSYHGIRVSSDPNILMERWSLIVVHGGDVGLQNYVLERADKLGGPVLYLIILPSHSPTCVAALHRVSYVGCSTLADWRLVRDYKAQSKAVRVRHGINIDTSVGHPGFRQFHGIKTPYMFLSSGGFWPNKAFDELVKVFKSVHRTDATLVLTGYDNRHGIMPPDEEFVRSFLLDDRKEMLSALMDADLYILNSTSEGFGLVLLESMINMTPWAARNIAGAELMRDYGFTYNKPEELFNYLHSFKGVGAASCAPLQTQQYVIATHLIKHTVDDIVKVGL
jgi:glycosyltransferase involved in cell wall biosynthesis